MDTMRIEPFMPQKEDAAQENQVPACVAALCARIWEYRGPQEKLHEVSWQADTQITDLIRSVVNESHGQISPRANGTLAIHFGNSLNALSAAKSLQVRLLTLQRPAPAGQAVAATIVQGIAQNTSADTQTLNLGTMLIDQDSAQILVSEELYGAAKDIPGFAFNPKPAHAAGERGFSEAMYELFWTDESTYAHVRKTGQFHAVVQTPPPSPLPAPAPAHSGASRYQILSELGRGAMGVVYKAHDQVIGRTVALKTISIQRNFADRTELVERLKQEAKAAGGLDHPNIITIYDVGEEKDFVYLSMQFVEGKTLAALLTSHELPPLLTLLSYAEQICNGVGYAHSHGVIHRDLKPANFMLTAEGTVKVLDFGIAKLGDASLTQTGMVVGTPTYMAPEQAKGNKLDQRSDIFSLGTVFYELFTREKPFKGDIPSVLYKLIHEEAPAASVVNPALPAGINAVIRKAMAKNPQDRYQTCEELRDALRAQAVTLTIAPQTHVVPQSARPLSNPITTRSVAATKTTGTHRQQRSERGAMAFMLLLLAALVGGGVWAYRVQKKTGALPPPLQKAVAYGYKTAHTSQAFPDSSPVPTSQNPTLETSAPSVSAQPETGTEAPDDSASPAPKKDVPSVDAAPAKPVAQIEDPKGNPSTAPGSTAVQVTPPQIPAAAPASADPFKTQTPAQTISQSPAAASASTSESKAENNTIEQQGPTDSQPKQNRRAMRQQRLEQEQNARVEGFSRADIPDLLSKADSAAGSGLYALARYEYSIVLRLDHDNVTAREGLARVIAARQERMQR
ncbi:MAG TPA: protein kinase [Terriglobales bacterium]|nr:protein kinase [Terriglobales bacterium]